MKKLSNNEAGFGGVELVLVIIVIVLLGVMGWLFYRNHHQSTATTKQSTASKTAVSQPAKSLYPADAPSPASGTCGVTTGTVVTVNYGINTPDPVCQKVSASQTLEIKNPTNSIVKVSFANNTFTLAPNTSHSISGAFSTYLAKGVHNVSFNGTGDNAELWLQ